MSDKKETVELTAGEMLANARTNGRRKRELATIARQLCIKEEFLDSIERGQYQEIPELVYILGFARNYALEVGLDPETIVKKIKKEMGLIPADDEELAEDSKLPDSAKVVPSKVATKEKKKAGQSGKLFKNIGGAMRRHWKWLVGALVLIAFVIVVGVLAMSDRTPDVVPEDAPEVITVAMVEPVYNIPVKETFGTASPTTQIVLQATAETWLKVEDSKGETLFSRVLAAGDVYYVPAGGAVATVGNAGGLDVWVDGRAAPKLGARGAKRSDISLTPESLIKE